MGIKSVIAKGIAHFRAAALRRQAANALVWQSRVFKRLIRDARHSAWGQEHGYGSIRSVRDFQARVPVRDYEQAKSWFDRIYKDEADVCWPGRPLYLAKTSGTTSGAKYIPITRQSIQNQIGAARDALLLYVAETGKADFFDGKMMFLSGSPNIEENEYGMRIGRLSGIVNHFVPAVLTANRVPSYDTNCIEDWEQKIDAILREIVTQDLRLISGIPPWVQMLFERLQESYGKSPLEAWPNLSLFVQGGVDFSPYRPVFNQYLQQRVDEVEVFPASEGFFAIQDSQRAEGLLLLPNNGVFYEFIPMESYGQADAPRLTLAEVELNKQYALVVSTNAGLWAYDLGDTVRFTSLSPYRIRVTGRVKHFISAFGEHVIAEEVNTAMLKACADTGADFQEFTVAPLISPLQGESCHEWLVEFTSLPADQVVFAQILDQHLQQQNVYYKDLRAGAMLRLPVVSPLTLNASRNYMKAEGKLGGQNKFPRLSNNRKIADALAPFRIHNPNLP